MKECGDIYETFNEKQIWSESVDRPDHQFKNWTGGAQQHCRAEQDISTVSGTGICKS